MSLFLALAVFTAACGGSDDPEGSPPAADSATGTDADDGAGDEPAPDEDASGDPGSDAGSGDEGEQPAAPPADPPVATGDPVDPTAVDACSILSLDDITAATGATASDPVAGELEIVASCTIVLGGTAGVLIEVELELPPGSQTIEGRPFAVGTGGLITDSPGYLFALTDVNGWLVKLSGLYGDITEAQLVAIGQLLEQRLLPRDAAGGGDDGGAPPLPTGDGSGDGTCSVEVTGALTASFTSGQDIGEAYVSAWIPEAEQAQADEFFPGGAPDFQIACSGDDGQSILISMFDVDVPLGSTSVTVPDNTAGYFADDGIVGNRGPAEIVLTTFDEERIAGSITFTGDGLGTGEATVTMTFDFTNSWGS